MHVHRELPGQFLSQGILAWIGIKPSESGILVGRLGVPRSAAASAEGPAYGLIFARRGEFPLQALQARKLHASGCGTSGAFWSTPQPAYYVCLIYLLLHLCTPSPLLRLRT